MNSIRIALAALGLSATALAQASEVTNFAVPPSSSLSRAEVRAEARKLIATDSLRYTFIGPVEMKAPASTKSRDEVRNEAAAASKSKADRVASSYLTGGM